MSAEWVGDAPMCAVCGAAATQTVAFEVGGQDFEKDLCPRHLAELLRGVRALPLQGGEKPVP